VKRALVLFTRDLRVHDHAALSAAVEIASEIVPLFVLDDALRYEHSAPVRRAFLLDSLGDVSCRTNASAIAPLARALVTTSAGEMQPKCRYELSRDVPSLASSLRAVSYWCRSWRSHPSRRCRAARSPLRSRRQARASRSCRCCAYVLASAPTKTTLAAARCATRNVSSTVSPRRIARSPPRSRSACSCWRDFYLQLNANPHTAMHDLHNRDRAWIEDEDALAAWAEGRTGYPIVDAAMRQLRAEGGCTTAGDCSSRLS
jgi:FAD binding domain of DNA photolyase/DNA photolyase